MKKSLALVFMVTLLSACTSAPTYNYRASSHIEVLDVLEPMNTPLHFVVPGTYRRIGEVEGTPMYSGVGVQNGGFGSPAAGLIKEGNNLCIITKYNQKVCDPVRSVVRIQKNANTADYSYQ